jgi:predicted nucleotidyltransferase
MRINPTDELFGFPVLKVREVIRFAMQERLSGLKRNDILKAVAKIINCSQSEAKELFNSLLNEEYLTIENKKFRGSSFCVVAETEKGRRLGVTRANPPITRAKANILLEELLDRVNEVNNNEGYVYKIESVKVFGSYLSEKEMIGDLDVAIKIERKVNGDEFMNMNQKRIQLAKEKGRQFSNYVDEIFWPRREVLMHLSTRKKGLSIHVEGEDEVLNRVKFKVVYEAG